MRGGEAEAGGTEVVVLGGAGQMGSAVLGCLRDAGVAADGVSRRSGVDVITGAGLTEALGEARAVVDCLNIETTARRKAVDFFHTVATRVGAAAEAAGVERIYALSIVGATRPAVASALGYYAGKAAQEAAYAAAGVPVTMLRTTQWFTLATDIADRLSAGPVGVMPRFLSRPIAPERAAAALAEAIADGREDDLDLAGPEVLDLVEVARTLRPARRILSLPVGPAVMRDGSLLPDEGAATLDDLTLALWAHGDSLRE